eukprot:CAMPEP_0115832144 /NCGR_PEP_ID=MMETSP0287-20121206/2505_1 /TAXON_ID=412157 /ORGANISM="Chrysochromulina rotalis, Strain UIO044" /LENGTH=191 /DNA_ID=CAMNT_0003285517 /DNA_START=105 /DNA_END=681 /DNA_ORIENTATION=+
MTYGARYLAGRAFRIGKLDHRVEREKLGWRHARLTCWLPGSGENELEAHGGSACRVGHERPGSGVCDHGLKDVPSAHEQSAASMQRPAGSNRSEPHRHRATWTRTASLCRQMITSSGDEILVEQMVSSKASRSRASAVAMASATASTTTSGTTTSDGSRDERGRSGMGIDDQAETPSLHIVGRNVMLMFIM